MNCLRILLLLICLGKAFDAVALTPSRQMPTPVHEAIAQWDLEKLRQLLANRADPNASSPLAFLLGRYWLDPGRADVMEKAARLLLDAGANAREPGLLGLVARPGGERMVGLLLGAGATADSEPAGRPTALHVAARSGAIGVVAMLLKHGANPESEADDGCRPLHHALRADSNNAAVLRLLLASGAKAETRCGARGDTASAQLFKFYRGPDAEIGTVYDLFLSRGADPCKAIGSISELFRDATPQFGIALFAINRCVPDSKTLGRMLLVTRNPAHVETLFAALMNKGAAINGRGRIEDVPLHAAVVNGAIPMDFLERLIEKGADIKSTSADGETVLHRLVSSDRPDRPAVLNMLVARGAEINAGNVRGATPLARAVFMGRVDSLRDLLAKGADIGQPMDGGITPLHLAAQVSTGNIEIHRLLLEYGADPNRPDSMHRSPLHLAVASGANPEIIDLLLRRGANPNMWSKDGRLPIHHLNLNPARVTRVEPLLKVFCAFGVDILAPNRKGQNIVDLARQDGYIDSATFTQSVANSPSCRR